MADMENTVAMPVDTGMETSADDAQATEVSVEELAAQFTQEEPAVEEVENEGDDSQTEQVHAEPKQQEQETNDKFGKRIASALKNQEKTLIAELGGGNLSKAEIMEIVREHRARKMHEEDPEISAKAARKILEAQENASKPAVDPKVTELSATMKDMISKGYTPEELKAIVSDATVREDIENGKTLWQAARAYERRRAEAAPETTKKRAPRTARSTAAGDSPQPDLIASIPDDKYDSFMEDLRRRAMRGEKVRI